MNEPHLPRAGRRRRVPELPPEHPPQLACDTQSAGGWPRRRRRLAAKVCAALASLAAVAWTAGASADSPPPAAGEHERCAASAAATKIIRDEWGIAHVHGLRDADAVFGAAYAQAEDDFNRVETNYLTALGLLAAANGEQDVYRDLRARLFVTPGQLQRLYAASPAWLRDLMSAWAGGLNCFLASHPAVTPRVIRHFEPWMALSFTEGSIGGDIERVPLGPLQAFYGGAPAASVAAEVSERLREPSGSNGIALGPSRTLHHHALLLINPHTTFFFRSELQMTSDEGLNAYGAVTWGQFFIYQGFNDRIGWMHTSSGVDNVDFYAETVVRRHGHLYYRYGRELRPVTDAKVTIAVRSPDGGMGSRVFTVYRTHHGPIVQQADGHWIAIALMQRPVEALRQSFGLTKARDYRSFMAVMELQANSSNNTIYADADGNIAYLHPQFVPRRDDRIDFTRRVDGADPATDWKGLHALAELPHVLNPSTGWVMNTNDWPYSAAGLDSPLRERFPRYMDTVGENPRGEHATALLSGHDVFTLESLTAAAYDSHLPALAGLVPLLVSAYDGLDRASAQHAALADPIALLRTWDYRWSPHSFATTIAVLWGDSLWDAAERDAKAAHRSVYATLAQYTSPEQKLGALTGVIERLQRDFGTWRVAWGSFNRFQRLTGDIVQDFSDAAPSIPVAFASARWGSLASFGARRYPGTNKYYGTSGNSFVAAVEFGDTIVARAVSAGGESGDARSPHFADQSARYADGSLREVYFYPAQLIGHTERAYHPE